MKKVSDSERKKIKAAFEKLGAGDVITTIGEKSETLVVIRHIDGRAVLGVMCQCGKRHINEVIDDTYLWSNEKWAIVGNDGSVPVWWSVDLQLERNAEMDIAKEYSDVPVSADYPNYSRATFINTHATEIKKGVVVMTVGTSLEASMRRIIEMAGVSVNDEQARIIFFTIVESAKLRSSVATLSMVTKLVMDHKDYQPGARNIH